VKLPPDRKFRRELKVDVGWPQGRRLSQEPAALGILVLEHMAPARSSKEDFPGAGYFEPFAHRFPGLNSFGRRIESN
jgi:hypothetical protein